MLVLCADFNGFRIEECDDPSAHAILVGEFESCKAKVSVRKCLKIQVAGKTQLPSGQL